MEDLIEQSLIALAEDADLQRAVIFWDDVRWALERRNGPGDRDAALETALRSWDRISRELLIERGYTGVRTSSEPGNVDPELLDQVVAGRIGILGNLRNS